MGKKADLRPQLTDLSSADRKADTYNEFRQGEFTLIIWGLNLGGFIILLFALAICGSTLCFCF
jgi:hypothetical protein